MCPDPATYTCPDCGRIFTWKRSLNRHRSHECGKEPQFPCPYCDKRLTQRESLKRHIFCRHPQHAIPVKTRKYMLWYLGWLSLPCLYGHRSLALNEPGRWATASANQKLRFRTFGDLRNWSLSLSGVSSRWLVKHERSNFTLFISNAVLWASCC